MSLLLLFPTAGTPPLVPPPPDYGGSAQPRTYTRRDALYPRLSLFPSPTLYPDSGEPQGHMSIPPTGATLDLGLIIENSPYTTRNPEIQSLLRMSGLFTES